MKHLVNNIEETNCIRYSAPCFSDASKFVGCIDKRLSILNLVVTDVIGKLITLDAISSLREGGKANLLIVTYLALVRPDFMRILQTLM